MPLAIELWKNSIRPTLDTAIHKNVPLLFFNSSVKHGPIFLRAKAATAFSAS